MRPSLVQYPKMLILFLYFLKTLFSDACKIIVTNMNFIPYACMRQKT